MEDNDPQFREQWDGLLPHRKRNCRNSEGESSRSKVHVGVYILIVLFGISSWIGINGLWVEIPLLVSELPEGWNLPSYLVITMQIANIGPLFYVLMKMRFPSLLKDGFIVAVMIAVGATACILLAGFWDHTTYFGHEYHSIHLLVMTAFLSLVDCTSSVVYVPYMSRFKLPYMTAYYIGEGLSGLIPGLVGLAQGVGSEQCFNASAVINNTINANESSLNPVIDSPKFSVQVFFIVLFSMMCTSGMSFAILHNASFCRSGQACGEEEVTSFVNNQTPHSTDYGTTQSATVSANEAITDLSTVQFFYLLTIAMWISFLINGILPSTQPYSCLPYGNLAYTLAVRLSTVAAPLVSFIALFLRTLSLRVVTALTVIGSALAAYQIYLATASPDPPLKGHLSGVILVILTQVFLTGCLTYVKVAVTSILTVRRGRAALVWCGGACQLGSCIGAIIIFLVINKLHVLHVDANCL